MTRALVISIALLGTVAYAAPTRLTFEEASRLALQGNPDLTSLRMTEESLKYKARQSLAPNNPTLTIMKNDLVSPSPFKSSASSTIGIQYTLGFPGKALADNAQFNYRSASMREQSLGKEIELLMSLSNVYVALFVNDKAQSFLADEVEKAKNTVRLIEKKYSLAKAQQSEVLNARVVASSLEHELLTTKDERETLLAHFRALIKRPEAKDLEPEVPGKVELPEIGYNSEDLTKILLKNRPLLKAAVLERQAEDASVSRASLSALPDLQMTGNMNLYHLPDSQNIEGVNRTYSVGISLVIPIFFPLNDLSNIHAARKERDAAIYKEEAERVSSMADLQSLVVKYQGLKRQKKNLETYVLPATKASYDLTVKAYSLGSVDYLKLNAARETWIESEKEFFQKILAAAEIYNQITQQIGCDLAHKDSFHACI
jgi:outer membrane protein TolC